VDRRKRTAATALDEVSPGFILLSRILIALMTLLLAVIPWSERYSMMDNFPHGQDTELNLLAFFVILGLILLFVRSRKKGLSALFAIRYFLLSIIRFALSFVPDSLHGVISAVPHSPPLPSPSLGIYNLPLQI